MFILQKLHFWLFFVILCQNITQISSEYHPKHARYLPKRDQRPSETKKLDFVLYFIAYLKKGTDSLQSGEGHMHEVCEIAAKMSRRGPRAEPAYTPPSPYRQTVRTPRCKHCLGKYW